MLVCTVSGQEVESLEMAILQSRNIGSTANDEERNPLSIFGVTSISDTDASVIDQLRGNIYTLVIYFGLARLDPKSNWKWQKIIYVAALITAIANSLIALFMPCMVDVASLVCN